MEEDFENFNTPSQPKAKAKIKDHNLDKMVNKAKTVKMDRKVSSKIMDKASNNLVANNLDNKVTKLAIVRMETIRMVRTNSNKVRPKTPIKDNRVNNPISSKTNSSRIKNRTVRTTTMEMASLMT